MVFKYLKQVSKTPSLVHICGMDCIYGSDQNSPKELNYLYGFLSN